MEKIKDFFHDFSDIFFAIIIAGVMFAVLSVNLGSWFNVPSNTASANEPFNTSKDRDNNATSDGPDNNNVNPEDKNNKTETGTDTDKIETEKPQNNNDAIPGTDENEQKNETAGETKKIIIPSGTFCTGIAKILKNNELIDNENSFVQAAENLGLSSRLKSGSFEIPVDATVEEIVKIIAGQLNNS